MAKLTLADGTVFEGTTEEIFAITERFGSKQAEAESDKQVPSPAKEITHNGKEYTLVDRKAQAGDIVVFTKNNNGFLTNGKPYGPVNEYSEVIDNEGDSLPVYRGFSGRTEANTLVYAPKVEPLKVGDFVVVSGKSIFGVDLDGKVCNYRGPSENFPSDYARVKATDDYVYLAEYGNLRKATDEEIAEAKALVEKDAVFTRLGRKPGEFKKGDIVRITEDHALGSVNEKGDIGEITEVVSYGFTVFVNARGNEANRHGNDSVELIAPVESRVDAS